jgi:hypothetical protein
VTKLTKELLPDPASPKMTTLQNGIAKTAQLQSPDKTRNSEGQVLTYAFIVFEAVTLIS